MRLTPFLLLAAAALALPARAQSAADWFHKGRALMDSGKADQAVKAFENAVKLDDRNSSNHLWLANALGTVAQKSNVIKQGMMAPRIKREMERARDLDSTSIEAHRGMMQFYLGAPGFMGGSVVKARAEAAAIGRLNRLQGHLAAVTIAQHEKDSTTIERELRAAVTDDPDSASAYVQLGFYLANTKRGEESIATIDRLLARHPGHPLGLFYLGRFAGMSGLQLDRAEKSLRQFLALPPDTADKARPGLAIAHTRLADVLAKKGAKDDARKEYEAALQLNPKLDPAQSGLKQLRDR